jgi:hypothetical protein
MCCPIGPPDERWILSRSQVNFVVVDREAGEIALIPNIRLRGNAADFALVVPTPSFPRLAKADRRIWEDARELTAPVRSQSRDGREFLSCSSQSLAPDSDTRVTLQNDVTIHGRQTIGAFDATILSAEDPDALANWLNANGYAIPGSESGAFAPYVARGWFFTAMKLDTSDPGGQMPPGGWDADVDPVSLTYSANRLEIPLPILRINADLPLPMTFYVVDDRRTAVDGFRTAYANRISAAELLAIGRDRGSLASHLGVGSFLTRLDGTFRDRSAMTASTFVEDAPDDEEFRRIASAAPPVPLELALFAIPVLYFRLRRRGGRAARG